MKLVVKARDLTKTILTPEQSFEIVKEGAHAYGSHADFMPTFKYVYKDEEIEDVVYYISKAFNPKRDERIKKLLDASTKLSQEDEAKMLKVGAKIFNRNCSMCHGITGNGKSDYVEQSKAQDSFIYPYDLRKTLLNEDEIFLYSKFGGHFWGTSADDMPSWKKKYN
ncbi:c-type cytochrome, partial [Sulfurimonas sp. SAG-AH-194-I05]|nr:c-type cytochrome [Sulfurimonas sp. SAG-AH-194-I05]